MDPKCNLIIDSCCDLPYDVINRPGVTLVQFPYLMDGVAHSDDMFQSVTPKEFYDSMRDDLREKPSTSQVPQHVLHEAFTAALQSGTPTVYLCFSSGLSGSYDAAALMAEQLAPEYPEGKLYVVDTKLASIAEGLLVLGAMEQRDKGLTAEEMVAWAEEARYYVAAQFMVEDLDSLRRGGRIPAGVALAGAKLDVKPILGFDLEGNLSLTGMARGRKKGIRQLLEYYAKNVDTEVPGLRVVLGCADCEKERDRLRGDISKLSPEAFFTETSIGPVIGSHVGPGMLAVVFWGPDRRARSLSVADRIARRVKDKE